ncbi:MAG: SusC/RagA family TonB-linked outer membrane protein [Flavobacteriales bacterium]|nr:SusC/RagA family TonB-linked outer membrane protein [Flavobacteriales bacterium]
MRFKFTGFLALVVALFAPFAMMAQELNVSGTVTSSEDGLPMPGVSIIVVGSASGTSTDFDGNFSIDASNGGQLEFSFIGYTSKKVSVSGSTMNVVLDPDAKALDEVVVTALGISREKKALGYAVSEVGSDEVNSVPTADISSNLSGRVAGVQVSSSSGNMGGSSRVLLRGASSLQSNNQPLYVVDGTVIDNSNFSNSSQSRGSGNTADFGNMSQDINPDDVESISVLKGPSASALYGSRAANGVILITTKKGGKNKAIGVDVNFTGMWENVDRLPDYQNGYGGGYGDSFEQKVIDGKTYNIPFYGMDESWGPKLDGTPVVPWWSVYDWEANGKQGAPETSPWSANPDNIRDFFETGFLAKTNVAFFGGDDKSDFRMSYTNYDQSGVFPNSHLWRNTLNFVGNINLTDKLYAGVNATYVNSRTRALPVSGYSSNGIMQKFAQWGQRQWDMEKMKNYKQPDGSQRTWNRSSFDNPAPAYSDNAYWTQNENFGESERNRIYGNAKVGYKFNDWLTAQAKVNMDHYSDLRESRTAVGSADNSSYSKDNRELTELNQEFMLTAQKQLNESFHLSGLIGANRMDRSYQRISGNTDGGLAVPGIYSLNNSMNQAMVDEYKYEKRINSVFANATLGWNRLIYVDGSVRNDWSSTLPEDNNSYLYYSGNVSFILSELGGMKDSNWLDLLKVRAGYAQVGNDTDPYNLVATYTNNQGYGSNPMFSNPGSIFNAELKPETTNSWEVGLDMHMFDNRLGFALTYYDAKTIDQIMPVTISATSGYGARWLNAGSMSNKGFEASVFATPVATDNFSWDVVFNFSTNTNMVDELHPDVKEITLGSLWGIYVVAEEGQPYGMLKGANHVYKDGEKVVGDNGLYKSSAGLEELGSVLPDYNLGMINTLNYRGFNFSFTIDHQKGGHFFSTTNMWGNYSGLFAETAEGGIREDGLILPGVKEDGTKNDVRISATDAGESHYGNARGGQNVFEATYFKLREVRLGYSIPKSYVGPFQGISVNLVGKNLAIWGTDNPHLDPEQVTNGGNVQGLEGGANPPTKSYGFNVSFKL